jgi:GT2 family glycosyltransferase
MASEPPPSAEAVIICTRNRPDDLSRTLQSVVTQAGAADRSVLVVDASDPPVHQTNEATVENLGTSRWTHLSYDAAPSLTRQRNSGIAHLPTDVEVVHFLDDDVDLHPNYFRVLARALHTHEEVGGVGGLTFEDALPQSSPSLFHRRFLLEGPPGNVLPSGHVTSPQRLPRSADPPDAPITTSFLSGCSSSYSREVLRHAQFDPSLKRHSFLEDLDFSYRVSQLYTLQVIPEASLHHRLSPQNRESVAQQAEEKIRHRYWFVCKHDLSTMAFWWAVLGQFLARILSSHPQAHASLRGLLRGMIRVWRQDIPGE